MGKTQSGMLHVILLKLTKQIEPQPETGLNMLTDDGYGMEQINIAKTIKKNNSATTVKFLMLMTIIFIMTFIISVFPVMITVLFLTAPAIIMNIGWLVFAGSV